MSAEANQLKHSPTLLHDLGWARIARALETHCSTAAGAHAAASVPFSTDAELVRLMLVRVAEISSWYDEGHTFPFGAIETIDTVVSRVRSGGVLPGEDLFAIGSSLRGARSLSETILDGKDRLPSLQALGEAIPDLSVLTRRLFSTFEPSGKIRDSASQELSDLRLRQTRLRGRVKRQMEAYVASHELEPMLQDSYYTVRDERFVLPVRAADKVRFKGIIHGSSATGQTVFVEPQEMIGANNELLLLDESVRREEHRILRERTDEMAKELPAIQSTMRTVVELDLLHARSRLAEAMNASIPAVRTDGHTTLLDARHPGLVLKGNAVVANTIEVGGAWQILIVTGPNTGGKTVTLSTLGLCTLMTLAGMPIPALPGSSVAIFPRMFTLFGDAQDLERDLSTFSGHLEGMIALLREAGPGALALIDEPIVGTEPSAGAAMAISVLERLAERGVRGAVSTHYDRLKTLSLEDKRFQNASVGMDQESLQPTWTLTIGVPGRSSPLEMAARLGMPSAILERAQEILGGGHGELQRMLDRLEKDRSAMEMATLAATREAESLAAEKADLVKQGDAIARAAQAEALQEIAEARRAIAQAIRELQRAGDASTLRRLERKMDRADRSARAAVSAAPETERPLPEGKRLAARKDLVPGARVWVVDVKKNGVLREVGHDMGRIEVQVGALRLTRPLEELAVDGREAPSPAPARAVIADPVDDVIPVEVDLRGQRVDEAILELERALDSAMLAGRSHVRVIHGHGTGALRKACREFFKRSRHVAEWENGLPDEGGDGVSLVTVSDG